MCTLFRLSGWIRSREVKMRAAVRSALEAKGTPGKWNHITDQIGMCARSGEERPEFRYS